MTLSEIKTAVCEAFGIEESELFEKKKVKQISLPKICF